MCPFSRVQPITQRLVHAIAIFEEVVGVIELTQTKAGSYIANEINRPIASA